jgi:prepilin-type N-terminal cleavage/methylation domain-containing protein
MSLRQRGFTLIELLVVVAIIFILVALLAAGLGKARESAKSKASRALIGRLQVALENYHSEFRDYPPDGYDQESPAPPAPVVNNQGVPVGVSVGGSGARRLKGTALLMYYLCRPLIKITYMGAPPLPGETIDPRNVVSTAVGPFLTLNGSNYSRGRPDQDSTAETFDPGFVWTGPAGSKAADFWDTRGMSLCEIIDGYGRPLCYDKVKTNTAKFFQPDRFHYGVTGSSVVAGKGTGAHPDTPYMQNEMPTFDDDELACPTGDITHGAPTSVSAGNRYLYHQDPRFIPAQRAADGCNPSDKAVGSVSTHAPKNVGGYDLWSFGKSFTNTNDDITSWGE